MEARHLLRTVPGYTKVSFFFFFAVLAIKKLSLSFIACAIDETNPVVKSLCETVPKSLFCASTCVLGFEDAP